MAWAQKIRAGSWRGRYRDENGVKQTVIGGPFTHKAEALRKAAEAEEATRRRKRLGTRNPEDSPTWREWAEVWWKRRHVDESTKRTDLGRVKKYLIPKWGPWKLHQITRGDVREWVAEMRTPDDAGRRISDTLIQRLVHLLSASLQSAVESEVIAANPARALRLNTPDTSRERFLTPEEFWAVHDAIGEDHRTALRLLADTGMRLGEATGLHKAQIHHGSGLIEVRNAWDDKSRVMKTYPKRKSRRFVPLPEWLQDENTASKRGETCGQNHTEGKCPGGLFLQSPEGSVLDPSRLRNAFMTACEEVGLTGVRLHDLRHTYASWLIQGGVSLAEVGRLLGHRSPQTTARYAHLADVPKGQILAALPKRSAVVQDDQQDNLAPGEVEENNGPEPDGRWLRLVK